jgi:hypothetical protein
METNGIEVSAHFGNGGWVAITTPSRPQLVAYIRLAKSQKGRYVVREFYVDGSQTPDREPLTGDDLDAFNIEFIEGWLNMAHADVLDSRINVASAVHLSVLASHFATTFGDVDLSENWVAAARFQQSAVGKKPVSRQRLRGRAVEPEKDFRMRQLTTKTDLTDEFLEDVARAYSSALARGERPNVSLAEQTGRPARTVERWVSKARDREIMPPARRGVAG